LGIGLHSYGFMQKAFPWLVGFMLSQFALMAIAGIPFKYWRSYRTSADVLHSPAEREQFEFTPPKLAVETTPE
jgi:hypothetical protein